MKKLTILAILLVAVLMGCNKKVVPSTVVLQDSTTIHVTNTSVIEDLPGIPDSAIIRAFLQCDSLGNIHLQTIAQLQGDVVSQALMFNGKILEVEAKSKIRIIKEVITRDSIVDREVEVPVPYPVETVTNRLTSWQGFQIWLGRILLITGAVYLLARFAGPKISVIKNLFKS